MKMIVVFLSLALSQVAYGGKMKIESPAFKHQERIPSKFTCEGTNVNPALKFLDIPQNAKSLVLIMDDPDAPMGTWVHWTLWNMNPATTEILEHSVPTSATQGITSFGKPGYGGPCPPSGTHRYFFKLFALDTDLKLQTTSKASDIEKAITGHIVSTAELIGLYSRKK